MKAHFSLLITITLLIAQSFAITACPTCVGRLRMNKQKKAFFSNDFYQPKSKQKPQESTKNSSKDKQQTAQRADSAFNEVWSES